MFKAKSNIKKRITISLLILSVSMSIFAHGNNISFNAGIERALNLTRGTKITTVDKSISQGDIFMSNYKTLASPQRSSTLSAITAVRKNIIGDPTKCTAEPTNDDILLILSSSKTFQKNMYTVSDIPLSTKFVAKGSITESCQKILYCIGRSTEQVIESKKEIQNCQDIVYQKYLLMESLGTSYLSQPTMNRNDNIFIDGNINNASFDLLHDIENIKKILFSDKSGPEIPQMIYYSMPSVKVPPQNNNQAIPGGISAFGGGATTNNGVTQTNSNSGITNQNSNTTTNSDDIIQNFINNYSSSTTTTSTNNQTNNTSNNDNENDSFANLDSTSIQNAFCPAPGSNDNNTINNNTGEDFNDILDEYDSLQGELFDLLSGFLYYGSGVGGISDINNIINGITDSNNSGNNNNGNVILTEQPSNESQQCTSSCASMTGEVEKQICEGKCCIDACKTISGASKKAICISQCLCGEFSTPNNEIRIRFCRVPAQAVRIKANRYVSTVEEAVDAISDIFKYLKKNNRMAKRTKTKELLDTSFTKTNLSKILSFNIFVAIKPIFNKVSIEVQKDAIKKKDNALKETINPTGTKLGDIRDKNKYIVIGGNSKVMALKSINTSFNDFNDNTKEIFTAECKKQGKIIDNDGNCVASNKDQKEKIARSSSSEITFAKINDELYDFISQNNLFWRQVSENFNSMLDTSQTLRKKAEKAK